MFFISSLFLSKIFSSTFNYSNGMMILSLPIFLFTMNNIPLYDSFLNNSTSSMVDNISFPIMMMTILLMMALESAKLYSTNSQWLFFFSFLTFSVSSIVTFYVCFELNLIPIFLIIMGGGYQPERLFASKMMMFYTLVGSLPLLLMIIFYITLSQFNVTFLSVNSPMPPFSMVILIMAFLIKLPIFSLHLWLPLAHVEAPLMGSMILAGVLLKLGGYGLLRMVIMSSDSTSFTTNCFMLLCSVGAVVAMAYCVTQVDLKIIIAYSSVGHMSIAAAAIFSLSSSGISAAMINFVAHGFTSSLMFFVAGVMYLSSGTRHILLNKGLLSVAPMLTMVWFLTCLLNAGGPPTMNLLAEILSTLSIFNYSFMLLLPLIGVLLIGMLFNMKIFSISSQGSTSENFILTPSITWNIIMSAVFHLSCSALLLVAIIFMLI